MIFIFSKEYYSLYNNFFKFIVNRYIERPLLINGSKFDLRLYVLVTSVNPLRVFMYHNGLARFASGKFWSQLNMK